MEVTRKNFKEVLPLVSVSIEEADFLVIDAEFSGLIKGREVSMFDSPEEYYLTLLNGSTEFLLIQFGLCAFIWDEKTKKYRNDAYNFYLFPRGGPGYDKMFLCQSSSLEFLALQGFDFNKLFRDGISYVTDPVETKLRENLTERQKSYSNDKGTITIPDEYKAQIEDICKNVGAFVEENKANEMEIDRCNAFVRRLLFQELGSRFKNDVFLETKVLENKDRTLKITRMSSSDDRKNKDQERKEKEWEDLEDIISFSKVARLISQSGKLVIGHNMLLDLLHTLNHFFQPLPVDYPSFKEFAHCMFPRVLDTKYMSSLPPFKDKLTSSVLQHLLVTLSQPPFSMPDIDSIDGRGYCQSPDKQHEAGYDAYVTGLCFLSMHAHLARMRGEESGRVTADSVQLRPFLNKVFLAKTAHQDSPYMNLAGDDPSPSREHIFHLTFPRDWQRNEINQLFSAYGQIIVQFLDDKSALVALTRRDLAKTVVRAFANNKKVVLVPFSKYKQRKAKELQLQALEGREESSPVYVQVNETDASRNDDGIHCIDIGSPIKRRRSSSLSTPGKKVVRKRTSSGIFQVEESEPPLKRPEIPQKETGKEKTREIQTNGGRKVSEEKKKEKAASLKRKDIEIRKDMVLDKFDSKSTAQCVTAFKENDCWD
ncbi:poly(A)-specific ribonuclease PARN [Pieris rapae]|uniref:poly(A)-specific ribonuclease PARN n=1 Tax=Pieris rapae TaxID=64459 RepID=UPI001E27D068|nr:poly(A)-specific ribonuclease PARN [Pieris rapae]